MKLLIVGLILLGLAFIGSLIAIGVYLSPKDDLQKSDVIVAVSGGETRSRALEAVSLYKAGYAPLIIFSGAAKDPLSPSNASVMKQIAVEEGIPPDVISVDESSLTTKQNANEVANIIQALKLDSIILVTSPYHQRRTYLEFKDRLGQKVQIINNPAIDHAWGRRNWWQTPQGWYLTITELPKTLFTLVTTTWL